MKTNIDTIKPNIQILPPKVTVNLYSSLDKPRWELEGEKLGTLKGDGKSAIYTTPDNVSQENESDILSFFKKDIVTAFEDGKYYNATMLITDLHPSSGHKLELETYNNQKRLEFFVNRKDTGWEKVPLRDTTWYTLAGNGRVDPENGDYYSSGDQPSTTAILALDNRSDFNWWFAVIIVEAG